MLHLANAQHAIAPRVRSPFPSFPLFLRDRKISSMLQMNSHELHLNKRVCGNRSTFALGR